MPTKSLLINYNDCPSSIDSLMPDNGLASLAGSLLAAGHKTQILDYATIQTLRDFRPGKIRNRLKIAYLRYKIENRFFGKMSERTYEIFRNIDDDINRCRDKKIREIIDEIAGKVRSEKLDFVAFKLWSGEGFLGSVKIAEGLRSTFPQLKIFAGGPHCEIYGERTFSFTNAFDVLCQSEGEETIVQLADFAGGAGQLADIPNIIYKDGTATKTTPLKFISDLNDMAEAVYDEAVYPAMKDGKKLKIIMMEESRGCPYSCNFCIHRIKSGNKWRLRNVDKVVNTIEALSHKLNTRAFRFSGSNTPYFYRNELAKRLIDKNLNIKYVGFSDTRQPESEDYDLLRRSGCVSLFFGMESADPYLLEHMINKNTSVEWIRDSLTRARKAGILTSASIIVPCPGETEESLEKTVDLLLETKPYGVSVYPAVCYPKTKWLAESTRFGFDIDENFEEKMMTFTIKFTMPPPMLTPLPFKVDGKDFYAMVEEILKISKRLEAAGITTSLNDSLLMIGDVLKLSPPKVKKLNQTGMILGNCEELSKKIAAFNSAVKL